MPPPSAKLGERAKLHVPQASLLVRSSQALLFQVEHAVHRQSDSFAGLDLEPVRLEPCHDRIKPFPQLCFNIVRFAPPKHPCPFLVRKARRVRCLTNRAIMAAGVSNRNSNSGT